MRQRARAMTAPAVCLWLLAAVLASPVLGQAISLEFDDAPVDKIYQTLGEIGEFNVLLDPSVEGRATLSLDKVDAMEAVELVAELLNHNYVLRHGTLLVAEEGRWDEITSRSIAYHTVKNVDPEGIREALAMVLSDGQIFVHEDLVILHGDEQSLRDAGQLLEQLDRAKVDVDPEERQSALQLLEAIAAELDRNLVADPELADKYAAVTLRRDEAREVLDDITELLDLNIRLGDETLFASLRPEEDEEEREQVKVYNLDYADPEQLKDALTMIVDPDRVRADVANERVMVRAMPDVLVETDALVWDLDVPKQQVLMEVWVHEMSTDALKDIGIEMQGVPSFSGSDAPKFLELVWEPWELVMALRVLEERGKAQVLAKPTIAAISGEEASIFVGDEVPITREIRQEDGSVTIELDEYKQAGVDLKVTPRISSDGFISIHVMPEVSTFTGMVGRFPEVRTRRAETTVRVKDGQPIMIGGLLQEEELEELRRIPLLADLPILGKLFEWKKTDSMKTEMNIFLIPRIVDGKEGVVTKDFFTPTQ